jgi:hypothetical protein
MNWLATLWTGLWSTPKPAPRSKEVMIMSTPAPHRPTTDVLHLSRPGAKSLTLVSNSSLTNGIPQPKPDLVGNNASGTIPIMLPPLVAKTRTGIVSARGSLFSAWTVLRSISAWKPGL